MADLKAIRDGIKTALQTISGLNVYDTVPGSIITPCAIVQPDSIDYQVVQGSATVAGWDMSIVVLAQSVIDDTAQNSIDDYIAPTGASSIPAALVSDQTLGSVVDYAVVVEMDQYGRFTFNSIEFIGARLLVEVTA